MFKAKAGRKIKILFSTKDAKGNLFYEADNQVDVRIQASSGNFVKKKIEDNLNGNYIVSFTSHTVGSYSIIITVNGQPLTGSPWSVEVSPHQYQHAFGITVDKGSFFCVAVNKKTNEIAIAQDDLVLILSADHSYVTHFQLEETLLSMDFTINGSFIIIPHFILDRQMHLFDENGKFIKHIGQGYLIKPRAVSVSHDGNLIVCDWGDRLVKVLSPDGTKLLQSFSDPHFPSSPWFAVYHRDMFFVSYSTSGACVKTFNKDGVFLYDIGGEEFGEGRLRWPDCLAIDKFDNLIVGDRINQSLEVFTVEGNFLYKIQAKHDFVISSSIAVSNTGNLYVSNEGFVHVFQ